MVFVLTAAEGRGREFHSILAAPGTGPHADDHLAAETPPWRRDSRVFAEAVPIPMARSPD